MHLSTLLPVLSAFISLASTISPAKVPEPCLISDVKWTSSCVGKCLSDMQAVQAITELCNTMQTCHIGSPPEAKKVTAGGPGDPDTQVTAAIKFGQHCGDNKQWDTEKCVLHFMNIKNEGCPDNCHTGYFPVGWAKSECDGTIIGVGRPYHQWW